jgi:hypothetical protein
MNEEIFIDHFRRVPETLARRCRLLVATQPGEHVVGYWGGYNASLQSPNILTFDTQLLSGAGAVSKWISLTGARCDVAAHETASIPEIEQARPLTFIDAMSYPHPDEEWGTYAPDGYAEWLASSTPASRKPVLEAIQGYDSFYRANYPYSATKRPAFAVVGGWGLYIYENEWADYPEAENIAFTLAEAEPYYSVRCLPSGKLVCKAIIT